MKLGMGSRCWFGVQFVHHTGRELYVEVLDGEFARNEARQKLATRTEQKLILLSEIESLFTKIAILRIEPLNQILSRWQEE
jgi:hypothetical protein